MPSASHAVHSAQHQSTPAIGPSRAEKRSGYSDNPVSRTAHLDATNRSEGIVSFGPRSRTFAPCRVLCRPLDKYTFVARSPTDANVVRLLATPPVAGPRSRPPRRVRSQATRQQKQSLFCLSDFLGNDKHSNELSPFCGLSDFRRSVR